MDTTWSEDSTNQLSRVTYLGIGELRIIYVVLISIMHIMPNTWSEYLTNQLY